MATNKSKSHKCSVCLELFTEPKVLPCCHTFCLECLKKTATSETTKGQVTCPQCRQSHPIPEGGLTEFLTDFVANYGVEAVKLKSDDPASGRICGECEQPGPVCSFCTDCQNFLCSGCEELHKKVKAYRAHTVIPKGKVSAAALQSCRVHYCSAHKAEALKLYCETCEKLICRDCTLVEHRQHSYKFVQDARTLIEAQMATLESDVEGMLALLKHNLQVIEKVETSAVSHPQVLKADINLFFDNLVQLIEARRTALLQKGDAVCEKDLKQIWADKNYHKMAIARISSVFGLAAKSRKCTSDSEMILTALQSMSQLKMIKESHAWDSHEFVRTVLFTPRFRGEDVAVDKIGSVDCIPNEQQLIDIEICQPYGGRYIGKPSGGSELTLVPSSGMVQGGNSLGGVLQFDVHIKNCPNLAETPLMHSLFEGRSGTSINLLQTNEPALKVVVLYGRSAKELEKRHISVRKKDSQSSSRLGICGDATTFYLAANQSYGMRQGFSGWGLGGQSGGFFLGHRLVGQGGGLLLGHGQGLGGQGGGLSTDPISKSPQKQPSVSYSISIQLICGGKHTLILKYGGCELKHSFTVVGEPGQGVQVMKGPDWKPHLSPRTAHLSSTRGSSEGVLGTVKQNKSGAAPRRAVKLGVGVSSGISIFPGDTGNPPATPGRVTVKHKAGTVTSISGAKMMNMKSNWQKLAE